MAVVALVIVSLTTPSLAWAQESARETPKPAPLGELDLGYGIENLWLESAVLFGLVTYGGFRNWNWWSSSFHFNPEGWFGHKTGSGGMDKLGHLYASYVFSDLLFFKLQLLGRPGFEKNLYPPLFSTALMLYVEMFDGFSEDHGWSNEDVVMNMSGIVMSYLRSRIPFVGRILDLRMSYFPSKGRSFNMITDYSGQTYFAVIKLDAFDVLRDQPLGWLELLVGYYTRGFLKEDHLGPRRREIFIGAGVNLARLFVAPFAQELGRVRQAVELPFHYLQVPYTYVSVPTYERTY